MEILDALSYLVGSHEKQGIQQYAEFSERSLSVHGGMGQYIKCLYKTCSGYYL